MKKSNYVFNMSNLIKNRVKYHAPINFYDDIDFDKILSVGIDLSLPVFIMEKPIYKHLFKAFEKAQKEVDFNLVLYKNNKRVQRKIKRCFVVEKDSIKGLEKLNINYKTCSSYHKVEKGNYLKIGKVFDEFEEKDFYLEQKAFVEGIFVCCRKFLISGENYIIEMSNCSNKQTQIEIEYNKELERGYYLFAKQKNGIKIMNLSTRENLFFNANFGKFQESYSCIDGLENSTYARINAKSKIELKPFEKKSFFINFGNKCFYLKNLSEMNYVFDLSRKKHYEIFDVKITSFDKTFERIFNNDLPLKIWRAWIDGKKDTESEKVYLDYKNQIFARQKKKIILLKNDLKIQDVMLYNGKYFKKIAASS